MRFAWSVTPALVAWPALMLPLPFQLAAVAGALGAALGVDSAYASRGLMPRWLMPLRFVLTGTAALSLLSSVPAALDAEKAAEAAAAEVHRLRKDAPVTHRALKQRERSLAEAKAFGAKARADADAVAARVGALETQAATREAELQMTRGWGCCITPGGVSLDWFIAWTTPAVIN